MSRTIWKGPFIEKSIIELINGKKIKVKNEIQITSRKTVIIPYFTGKNIAVYNGKMFLKIKITSDMVGHKFGEFVPTRKQFTYKKKKKSK